MTLSDDEYIRLKAVEISADANSRMVAGMLSANRTVEYNVFGMVDAIVEYVKTGKKPEVKP